MFIGYQLKRYLKKNYKSNLPSSNGIIDDWLSVKNKLFSHIIVSVIDAHSEGGGGGGQKGLKNWNSGTLLLGSGIMLSIG